MKKILLGNRRGKESSNRVQKLNTQINRDYRILPFEGASTRIDEYKQYLKEKKESNKYRLSFTISPICSNVLFNNISEIVYKEGSDDCKYFGLNGETIEGIVGVEDYLSYKGITVNNNTKLTRQDLIRDTGFTHPDIGPFVYHCGYDIFNNHTLRKREFNVVNKIKDGTGSAKRKNFNTISDYRRNSSGEIIKEKIVKDYGNDGDTVIHDDINSHLYQMATILTFPESIDSNLVEENGWIGFINKATLDIPNYVYTTDDKKRSYDISLNKTMNNNKNGEFINMYPDRSLYSFIPKVNKYRNNRLEPNWDYCLTYPYDTFDDNDLVRYKYVNSEDGFTINGLSCSMVDGDERVNNTELFNIIDDDESDDILYTLKTKLTNNLEESSKIEITVVGKQYREVKNANGTTTREKYTTYETIDDIIRVESVDKRNNTFTINGGDLRDTLYHFVDDNEDRVNLIDIRIRRVNAGVPCKYYFRKFKKINGGNINSVINKMGFSKNIYSDDVAQLLFNDDVNLGELRDNLGRELSEIFLTIIKNNKGYQKWYYDKSYGSDDITFSHCFGEVTSGIEMVDTEDIDYNIHKLHNVTHELKKVRVEQEYKEKVEDGKFLSETIFNGSNNPKTLEQNITIGDNNTEFLGDIVEFSPSQVVETVLEDVKHRFNTVQREYYYKVDKEFHDLLIDEIHYDDYDKPLQGEDFDLLEEKYNTIYDHGVIDKNDNSLEVVTYPVNIAPEGYFYQPHHRVLLKEFRNTVLQGKHEEIFTVNNNEEYEKIYDGYTDITKIKSNTNTFSYLSVFGNGLDKLWLYDKYGVNEKIEATLIDIGTYPNTNFTIQINKHINNILDRVAFETDIDGVINEKLYLPSKGSGKVVLIGKSFDIYVRGDIVKIGEVGEDDEIVGTLTNLNGVKVRGGKNVYYYMKNGVITELTSNDNNEPEVYESLGDRYRIYKPTLAMPNNAIELDDGSGRYLWRELKEEHEYETERGEISEHVFTNGAHYINKNINFFVRRQDPDGIYGLSNANIPVQIINNLTVGGYSVDNSSIEHYEIDEEGFVC